MSNNNSDQVSDDVVGLDQAVQIETTQVMTAQGIFQDLAEEVSDVEVNDNSSKQVSKESMEKILDVPVQLTAELGRTKITIKNVIRLGLHLNSNSCHFQFDITTYSTNNIWLN